MSLHRIDLPQKECLDCHEVGGLHFTDVLVARDVGDFSLAGAQTKFAAIERVSLRCDRCGAERIGRLENVTLSEDQTTFLTGHFIVD